MPRNGIIGAPAISPGSVCDCCGDNAETFSSKYVENRERYCWACRDLGDGIWMSQNPSCTLRDDSRGTSFPHAPDLDEDRQEPANSTSLLDGSQSPPLSSEVLRAVSGHEDAAENAKIKALLERVFEDRGVLQHITIRDSDVEDVLKCYAPAYNPEALRSKMQTLLLTLPNAQDTGSIAPHKTAELFNYHYTQMQSSAARAMILAKHKSFFAPRQEHIHQVLQETPTEEEMKAALDHLVDERCRELPAEAQTRETTDEIRDALFESFALTSFDPDRQAWIRGVQKRWKTNAGPEAWAEDRRRKYIESRTKTQATQEKAATTQASITAAITQTTTSATTATASTDQPTTTAAAIQEPIAATNPQVLERHASSESVKTILPEEVPTKDDQEVPTKEEEEFWYYVSKEGKEDMFATRFEGDMCEFRQPSFRAEGWLIRNGNWYEGDVATRIGIASIRLQRNAFGVTTQCRPPGGVQFNSPVTGQKKTQAATTQASAVPATTQVALTATTPEAVGDAPKLSCWYRVTVDIDYAWQERVPIGSIGEVTRIEDIGQRALLSFPPPLGSRLILKKHFGHLTEQVGGPPSTPETPLVPESQRFLEELKKLRDHSGVPDRIAYSKQIMQIFKKILEDDGATRTDARNPRRLNGKNDRFKSLPSLQSMLLAVGFEKGSDEYLVYPADLSDNLWRAWLVLLSEVRALFVECLSQWTTQQFLQPTFKDTLEKEMKPLVQLLLHAFGPQPKRPSGEEVGIALTEDDAQTRMGDFSKLEPEKDKVITSLRNLLDKIVTSAGKPSRLEHEHFRFYTMPNEDAEEVQSRESTTVTILKEMNGTSEWVQVFGFGQPLHAKRCMLNVLEPSNKSRQMDGCVEMYVKQFEEHMKLVKDKSAQEAKVVSEISNAELKCQELLANVFSASKVQRQDAFLEYQIAQTVLQDAKGKHQAFLVEMAEHTLKVNEAIEKLRALQDAPGTLRLPHPVPVQLHRATSVPHKNISNETQSSCWLSSLFQGLWHSAVFRLAFNEYSQSAEDGTETSGILSAFKTTWDEYLGETRLVSPACLQVAYDSAGFRGFGDPSEALGTLKGHFEHPDAGTIEELNRQQCLDALQAIDPDGSGKLDQDQLLAILTSLVEPDSSEQEGPRETAVEVKCRDTKPSDFAAIMQIAAATGRKTLFSVEAKFTAYIAGPGAGLCLSLVRVAENQEEVLAAVFCSSDGIFGHISEILWRADSCVDKRLLIDNCLSRCHEKGLETRSLGALLAAESEESRKMAIFEGNWQGGGKVDGTTIFWPNGNQATIDMKSPNSFCMTDQDGLELVAVLEDDGRLYWSDGDVWSREATDIAADAKKKLDALATLGLSVEQAVAWQFPGFSPEMLGVSSTSGNSIPSRSSARDGRDAQILLRRSEEEIEQFIRLRRLPPEAEVPYRDFLDWAGRANNQLKLARFIADNLAANITVPVEKRHLEGNMTREISTQRAWNLCQEDGVTESPLIAITLAKCPEKLNDAQRQSLAQLYIPEKPEMHYAPDFGETHRLVAMVLYVYDGHYVVLVRSRTDPSKCRLYNDLPGSFLKHWPKEMPWSNVPKQCALACNNVLCTGCGQNPAIPYLMIYESTVAAERSIQNYGGCTQM